MSSSNTSIKIPFIPMVGSEIIEVERDRHVSNGGTRDNVGHRIARAFRPDKPFIAWDGEGITYAEGLQQDYVLLAASTGDYVVAAEGRGLTTQDCFDLLFRVEEANRDSIHLGFGFGYDTNQILSSFTRSELYGLNLKVSQGRTYKWRRPNQPDYRIKIHPGKLFRVSKGMVGSSDYGCISIYDTFGFFQRRFIDVVQAYCPNELSSIESGKSQRGKFEFSGIQEIVRYCLSECRLLVSICDTLRNNFNDAELYLDAWYGPGAVANASLKKHTIKKYMGDSPKEVSEASKFAYQGGRFELFRAGYHRDKVWEYDINSAYPSAIVGLPQLSEGYWELVTDFEPESFGVWLCSYRDRRTERYDRYYEYRPHPLFYRSVDGRVAYPYNTTGWYWTPEAALLNTLKYPCDRDIKEGWVWRPAVDIQPFRYIEERYYDRLEMKRRGDGAERALKLEMNSVYGKLAQRSGWFQEGDRIPAYHQLEWAGYITSATRAKLYSAYNLAPDGIIAFETDAIFSSQPIHGLDEGNRLGEWEVTELDDLLYIQSGFYFANTNSDRRINHYRGFDRNSISLEGVVEWLTNKETNPFSIGQPHFGTTTRYIGFKRALRSRRRKYWRTWETEPKEITIGREGKRIHLPACPACRKGKGWMEEMHGLSVTHKMHPYGHSHKHIIPWDDIEENNPWNDEKELSLADG